MKHQVTVKLPADLHARLAEYAKSRGSTSAAVLRALGVALLERHGTLKAAPAKRPSGQAAQPAKPAKWDPYNLPASAAAAPQEQRPSIDELLALPSPGAGFAPPTTVEELLARDGVTREQFIAKHGLTPEGALEMEQDLAASVPSEGKRNEPAT